jgi:hypothetical protein
MRGVLVAMGVLGALACGSQGCPVSESPADVSKWEAALVARQPLKLNFKGSISVKRDVRDVLVDVPANRFAAGFQEAISDPKRHFGLIHVDRLAANAGKPFTEGEKFQGRYEVELAVAQQLRGKAKEWFGDFADSDPVRRWLCDIENNHTSNYGVISQLVLSPPPGKEYVVQYLYLEGSPIAGSSTFVVSEVTDPEVLSKYGVTSAARMRQIFEYQEQDSGFADFFSKGGLRFHYQVVFSQATQAAAVAGGKVLESDIPEEYRNP